MIHVDRDSLYTKTDLNALLGECGLTLRWFIDQVRPAKLAHDVWLGSDLLAAMQDYTRERAARQAAERVAAAGRRGPGRPRKAAPGNVEQIDYPERKAFSEK